MTRPDARLRRVDRALGHAVDGHETLARTVIVRRTAQVAVLAGLAGLLAAVPGLPVAIRGVLVGLFVLAGPGAAILAHLDLPLSTRLFAVPGLGIAAVVLATWATASTIGLSPTPVLLVLALATLAGAAAPALAPDGRP